VLSDSALAGSVGVSLLEVIAAEVCVALLEMLAESAAPENKPKP
jgi:hypothetical protein